MAINLQRISKLDSNYVNDGAKQESNMTNTYYISTNAAFYGSDATELDAEIAAEIIAGHASRIFPNVEFVVIPGEKRSKFDDDSLLSEVQQTINDNFVNWIA
jgi:hypothetical protein